MNVYARYWNGYRWLHRCWLGRRVWPSYCEWIVPNLVHPYE